jgi:hypothetical protein
MCTQDSKELIYASPNFADVKETVGTPEMSSLFVQHRTSPAVTILRSKVANCYAGTKSTLK